MIDSSNNFMTFTDIFHLLVILYACATCVCALHKKAWYQLVDSKNAGMDVRNSSITTIYSIHKLVYLHAHLTLAVALHVVEIRINLLQTGECLSWEAVVCIYS